MDARQLYRREACPSMFVYATTRLGLSEAEAYLRINVARIARRLPIVLERLAARRIQLSAIVRLAPHLTEANAQALLHRAEGRSKREIEVLVVVPLAPARYKVQFTASSETEGKLARARALLRHRIPDGDLAAIFDLALTVLVADLERRKWSASGAPRQTLAEVDATPSSRHVPAAVQRAVWQRDGGRCTFIDASGRRCPAEDGLEFHHDVPFALGGEHSLGNVRLLCKSHNRYQAELDFGADFMRQRGAERRASS